MEDKTIFIDYFMFDGVKNIRISPSKRVGIAYFAIFRDADGHEIRRDDYNERNELTGVIETEYSPDGNICGQQVYTSSVIFKRIRNNNGQLEERDAKGGLIKILDEDN